MEISFKDPGFSLNSEFDIGLILTWSSVTINFFFQNSMNYTLKDYHWHPKPIDCNSTLRASEASAISRFLNSGSSSPWCSGAPMAILEKSRILLLFSLRLHSFAFTRSSRQLHNSG